MKKIAFIALAILSMLACKKPTNDPTKDPEKPQQTQTGADILWCRVNGTPQLYKGKPTAIRHNGVHAYKQKYADSSVFIIIRGEDSKYSDGLDMCINVTLEAANTPVVNKKYRIADGLPYIYSQYYTINDNKAYRVDSNSSHIIFTRFDETVAAGTFEYHGINKDNALIHITEGFFDIVRE